MSTIERALGLLEHFSSQSPEIGLSDFKALSNFDKSTTHRYLNALKECGFVEQNPMTRAYRLGPAVIRLSAVREKTVPLGQNVARFVEQIAADMGELVHAALPQSSGMSMLCAVDGGKSGTRVAFDEAEILPFHATSSGIAMLAFGPPDLRQRVLGETLGIYTAHTPVDRDALAERIATARRCGYAVANQTFEADVCSVAVPFFDLSGLASGTIAIATPASRMSRPMHERITERLIETGTALTHSLGGKIPPEITDLWARGTSGKTARMP